jgi:hypothetical protein
MTTQTSSAFATNDGFIPKKFSRTGSWERVVVFHPESGNVDIQTKKRAKADEESGEHH